jgi:hypothetical protein
MVVITTAVVQVSLKLGMQERNYPSQYLNPDYTIEKIIISQIFFCHYTHFDRREKS